MKKDVKKVASKRIKKNTFQKGRVMRSELEKAEKQVGKLTGNVVKTIAKPFIQDKRKLTLGQRAADFLAKWAGSWFFIILFFAFIILWMATSGYFLLNLIQTGEFVDKYPYILLNLILSCLAAIQAPIILMSQNRSAQRGRLRAEYDYQVNRKAEREIREIKIQLYRIEQGLQKNRKN